MAIQPVAVKTSSQAEAEEIIQHIIDIGVKPYCGTNVESVLKGERNSIYEKYTCPGFDCEGDFGVFEDNCSPKIVKYITADELYALAVHFKAIQP